MGELVAHWFHERPDMNQELLEKPLTGGYPHF
jgi:hypothetical protein